MHEKKKEKKKNSGKQGNFNMTRNFDTHLDTKDKVQKDSNDKHQHQQSLLIPSKLG